MVIIISSPLLDLQTADGELVPAAQAVVGTDEEKAGQLEAMREDLGKQVAQQIRDIFTTGTVVNPSFRVFAEHGLFVGLSHQAGARLEEDRVQVPKIPSPVCYKCRAKSTGFEIRMVCVKCQQQKPRVVTH